MNFEYSVDGTIGTISLGNSYQNVNTPPKTDTSSALSQFLSTLELKGIVFQEKAQNLSAKGTNNSFSGEVLNENIFHEINSSTIPVVAVAQDECLDAFLLIALSCHFRFASATAQFGFSRHDKKIITFFDKIISQHSGSWRKEVTSLIRSGKKISSKEAKKIGLVNCITSDITVKKRACDFLKSLTEKRSSFLIRKIMQSIHNSSVLLKEEALYKESILFDEIVRKSISNG